MVTVKRRRGGAVAAAVIAACVLTLAVAEEKCMTGCGVAKGDQTKYRLGTMYKYAYESQVDVQLSSAEGQRTSTQIKATVMMTQLPDCGQMIRLQNVQIVGPDGKKRTGIKNAEKPIVINNRDGLVHDQICTEPDDTQNSLNLKRAIASMFQTAQTDHEIDVFGSCATQVAQRRDGDVAVVTKTKNLNLCAFREAITSDAIAATLDLQSDVKTTPYLNSDMNARVTLKNGALQNATIQERYLYVPFSIGKNGATAEIASTLTLIGTENDATKPQKCKKSRAIIFDNPRPTPNEKNNVQTILQHVKDAAADLDRAVDATTAAKFINLIKLLRVSKKDNVLAAYNQIRAGVGFKDKDAAKNLFLDAVLSAGTGNAIEVAIELLKNKELNEKSERKVYAGLSRAKHVTESTLISAIDLLNRANLPREAYLGVGALAGQFCKTNWMCQNADALKKLSQKLLAKLGDLKAANRKEENDMIYALKGLANIGILIPTVATKVASLAQDTNQPIRLRVVALETLLAGACDNKIRTGAMRVLKDVHQDAEVRIKAFLVVAKCPNAQIGNEIKQLLDKEESVQVGGFISSFIKNARASANSDKNLSKKHLGFVKTPKFPLDLRKFSRNIEVSDAIDSLGLSSSVESNIIYSQKSWLPRSFGLNLTAEVFGQRLNFLEVQARQENLEQLIEHYLGPNGIMKHATVQGIWDKTAKPLESIVEKFKEKVDKSLRAKRHLSKEELKALADKLQIKSNELNDNLDVDFSVKNFGKENFFVNSYDSLSKYKTTPEEIVDELIKRLKRGIDALKKFDETLRLNTLIQDAELSYPTSTGFPLRLGLASALAVQMKASGSVDAKALANGQDTNLKLTLIPSATLSIEGRLVLDTPLLENGLKTETTLHSALGCEIAIKRARNLKDLDVKVSFPLQKQTLIEGRNDIVFQTVENGVATGTTKLKFTQNKEFSVCLDQLKDFVGVEMCANFYGPNLSGKQVPILPFPLSGDAKIDVAIHKGDVATLHFASNVRNDARDVGAKVLFETLDKNDARRVALEIDASAVPDKFLKASLRSPIKNAMIDARLIDDEQLKGVKVVVKDEGDVYTGTAGIKVEGGGDKTTFRPVLEYTTPRSKDPQTPPIHLEGKITLEKTATSVKYVIDNVKLVAPKKKTITINGNFGKETDAVFVDVAAYDGAAAGSLKARAQRDADGVQLDAELKNTLKPQLNARLRWQLARKPDEISTNLAIALGKELKDALTLAHMTKRNDKERHFATKNKIALALLDIEGHFDVDSKPKSFSYDVGARLLENRMGSTLKLSEDERKCRLEFDLEAFGNKLDAKSNVMKLENDEIKTENSVNLNGKTVEINGKIKERVKPHEIDINVDLTVKIPTHAEPFALKSHLLVNPKMADATLKIDGANARVDVALKATKTLDVDGDLKIHVKNVLDVEGQIKAQKGTGNGHVTIDAKVVQKSAKAAIDFTLRKPTYNVDVIITPNLQNPDQMIKASSRNKESGNVIDSQNTLDLMNHQYQLNIKHSNDHQGKRSTKTELVLPNDEYLAATFKTDLKYLPDGSASGTIDASLEASAKKGTDGHKASLNVAMQNTEIKRGIYDIAAKLTLKNPQKTVEIEGKTARKMDADKVAHANELAVRGILEDPIKASLKSNRQGYQGDLAVSGSAGSRANVNLQAKYKLDPEKPGMVDVTIGAITPFDLLESITLNGAIHGDVKAQDKSMIEKLGGSLKTSSKSVKSLNIDVSGELELRVEKNKGDLKLKATVKEPIKASADIALASKMTPEHQEGKTRVALTLREKTVKFDSKFYRKPHKDYKFEASLDLPTDKYKSNKLVVKGKEYGKKRSGEAAVTIDDKTWTASADVETSSVEIKLTNPEQQTSKFYGKIAKASDKHLIGNLKVSSKINDFLLEGDLEVDAERIDDLAIKLKVNCPKIHVDKLDVEAKSREQNGARQLMVDVKEGGKVIITGSMSLTERDEQGKRIIEGSGSFKINGKPKTGNFKYIRGSLTTAKNGEEGEEVSLDATLGNEAIDVELKMTDKQLRGMASYCQEKNQCSHVEIDSKASVEGTNANCELEIAIDLRQMGLPNEFGLKHVWNVKNGEIERITDVHLQNGPNKYQYTSYLKPKEAGVSLRTPKRTVSLEGKIDVPKDLLNKGGKANAEIAFYTDKTKNPNEKSSLIANLDANPKDKHWTGGAQLKLVGLAKPLAITFSKKMTQKPNEIADTTKLALDVFAKADQQIVMTRVSTIRYDKAKRTMDLSEDAEIASSGLAVRATKKEKMSIDLTAMTGSYEYSGNTKVGDVDNDYAIKIAVSPKDLQILLRVFGTAVLDVTSQLKADKNLQSIRTEVSGSLVRPFVTTGELKNFNELTSTLQSKEKPDEKMVTKVMFKLHDKAEIASRMETSGKSKRLIEASLQLDDKHFLEPKLEIDKENVKEAAHLMENSANEVARKIIAEAQQIETKMAAAAKAIVQNMKSAAPDVSETKAFYKRELTALENELEQDKSLQNVAGLIKAAAKSLTRAVAVAVERLGDLIASLSKHLRELSDAIAKKIRAEIAPALETASKEAAKRFAAIARGVEDLLTTLLGKVAVVAEKLQPQMRQAYAVIKGVVKDLGGAIADVLKNVKASVDAAMKRLVEQMRKSPIVDELKAKWAELQKYLPSAQDVVGLIKTAFAQLKDAVAMPELRDALNLIENYLVKKISNEPVDDLTELQKIAAATSKAISKIGATITTDLMPQFAHALSKASFSLDAIVSRLPRTLDGIKFSPLAYVINEDCSDIVDAVLDAIMHPRRWILPPTKDAIIAYEEALTFDGAHVSLDGNCNYLLAMDALHVNFTVTAELKNGIIETILFADKSGIVKLTRDRKILFNGAETDYPLQEGTLTALATPFAASVASDAGVALACEPTLRVCGLSVSGYYHDRLRGVFGNANNEPRDERPDERAAGGACAAPKARDVARDLQCEKAFGWESPLRYCYPFVDATFFKRSCERISALGRDGDDVMTQAYVRACAREGVRVTRPGGTCTRGAEKIHLYEKFHQNPTKKSADVVVIVDADETNAATYEQLVRKLRDRIDRAFAARGVTDVQYHVIADGAALGPAHVTNGGRFAYADAPPWRRRRAPSHRLKLRSGHRAIDAIADGVATLTDGWRDDRAIRYLSGGDAVDYPFRPEALRVVIGQSARPPCKHVPWLTYAAPLDVLLNDPLISYNIIAPIPTFRMTDDKSSADVVGFNGDGVFALSDGKSKPHGDASKLTQLYHDDWCSAFVTRNGGNVIIQDNFFKNPQMQDLFVDVAAKNIVKQAMTRDVAMECECTYHSNPFVPEIVCKATHVK